MTKSQATVGDFKDNTNIQTEGENPCEASPANSPPHLFSCGLLSPFPQIFDTFLRLPTPSQRRAWPSTTQRKEQKKHLSPALPHTKHAHHSLFSSLWTSSSAMQFISFLFPFSGSCLNIIFPSDPYTFIFPLFTFSQSENTEFLSHPNKPPCIPRLTVAPLVYLSLSPPNFWKE